MARDDLYGSRSSKISESEESKIVPPRSFDKRKDPEDLAADQEVEPAEDFDELLGDFWPDNEGADEFVAALLRGWRHDGSVDMAMLLPLAR